MEIEIKLTGGSEALFAQVGDALGPYALGPARRLMIVDTYYDTADLGLGARGVGLRRREENGVALYTLKMRESATEGVVRRREVEVEATPANWERLLVQAGARPDQVVPILTVRTDRIQREVSYQGHGVAVASFDRVDYGDGLLFWDVEFELVGEAEEAHLRRLAGYLPGLTASTENKLRRGLRVKGI